MKVNIGNYKSWYRCYQLAENLLFWKDKNDDKVMMLGEWLAGRKNDSWLQKAFLWVEDKRKRTIKVQIDKWDTWSTDHTLSLIILPLLKQLKATTHGAPIVQDEDVPEELRSTNAPKPEQSYDVDDNHFKRWEWVLDEMIFAHEHIVSDEWENEYYKHANPDNIDWDGLKAMHERIQNGLNLFGKYYRGLWV
jgi:hypothetical protein